jgi:alpha-D-ribose 1-methylphosphonate 5-triphosphate diphosphatase
MHAMGVTLSEFPIDLETAKYAQAKGLKTIVGAPNILRGKSQSGSMRAVDAINAGVADCLCADYSPAALLAAVFRLPRITDLSLSAAINLVALNPAKAVSLDDRGEIAIGKRADLVAVAHFGELPQVSHTWSAGKLAYQASY